MGVDLAKHVVRSSLCCTNGAVMKVDEPALAVDTQFFAGRWGCLWTVWMGVSRSFVVAYSAVTPAQFGWGADAGGGGGGWSYGACRQVGTL